MRPVMDEIVEPQNFIRPWLPDLFKERVSVGKNVLALFTGEAGIGKSYGALYVAEELDPTFDIYRVTFTAREFLETMGRLKKGQFIVFDEPAVVIAHRDWYKEVNRVIVLTLETFRFKQINVLFTCIRNVYMDKVARELMHFLIIMKDRGFGEVYRVQPSQFTDKVRTPKCGEIYLPLPSKDLVDAYEERRAKIQDERYTDYFEQLYKKETMERAKSKSFATIVKEAQGRINELLDEEGEISKVKVMLTLKVSEWKARHIVQALRQLQM